MKKQFRQIITGVSVVTSVVFVVVHIIIGVKIMDNRYDYLTESFIEILCFSILLVCVLLKYHFNHSDE